MTKVLKLKYLYGLIFFGIITLIFIIIALPLLNKSIKAPVRADAIGYFSYLPAIFTKKDLSFKYMIDPSFENTVGVNQYEIRFPPEQAKGLGFNFIEQTGNYLNKYPTGVAVLLTPFFLIGHIFTIIFNFGQSGYSYFYQLFSFAGGFVYFSLGIYFLGRFLKNFFKEHTVFITIIAIIFATPLLNYATFENLYSHVYSFFLISLLLHLTHKWINNPNYKKSILLGINLGLILLVRQTNIIYFCISLFYLISNFKIVKKNLRYILALTISTFIICIPQLLYWKFAFGNFISYTYVGEGFSLNNAHILESLFSFERGLFVWSPVLLIALIGLFLIKDDLKKFKVGILFTLILLWGIVSTWSSWTFGWGFGHRIFVDALPLFAIGLCVVLERLKKKYLKILVTCLIIIFALLSSFQTLQYWLRILPPTNTTFEDYKKTFLNLDPQLVNYWDK
jgi:hypothetical protein